MPARLIRLVAGVLTALLAAVPTAWPQSAPPPAAAGSPLFTPEQLDQMLAPIALYPDALLAQVLMAATYPLEVVQASRWRQEPGNASLTGDQLAAAVESRPWDPSVKSLLPFPQILQMMDRRLDWTEALGDAFLAQEAQVMDAVQRLRQRAQAAGTLVSTPEQMVVTQDQAISIVPATPEIVYVPVYDPSVAYGTWPYPAYPPVPVYTPPAVVVGVPVLSFGFGVAIGGPLWGWQRWDWGRHRVEIDRPRFHAIDPHRPQPRTDTWQHDPAHRRGVPYRDAPTRDRFWIGPAPPPDAQRSFRGYAPAPAPALAPAPQGRPAPGYGAAPGVSRPGGVRVAPPAAPPRPAAPAFESFGRGTDARIQSDRGRASRGSIVPAPAPRTGPSPGYAPRSPAPPSGGARPGSNPRR